MNLLYFAISAILLLISFYQQYKIDKLARYVNVLLIKSVEDALNIAFLRDTVSKIVDKTETPEKQKEVLKD